MSIPHLEGQFMTRKLTVPIRYWFPKRLLSRQKHPTKKVLAKKMAETNTLFFGVEILRS
jgi:hypothetical protein